VVNSSAIMHNIIMMSRMTVWALFVEPPALFVQFLAMHHEFVTNFY
jgi:hypothetical protein